MVTEVWKDIPGFHPYQASDQGRIRRSPDAPLRKGGFRGRVLKNTSHTAGYVLAKLYVEGHRRSVLGHRLVALAFLGPRLPGMTVNHKDGCKTNNAVSNLEYVTSAENTRHAHDMGLAKPPPPRRGRDNSTPRKLCAQKVLQIRERSAAGDSMRTLATAFGVSRSLIMRIKQRKVWSWV